MEIKILNMKCPIEAWLDTLPKSFLVHHLHHLYHHIEPQEIGYLITESQEISNAELLANYVRWLCVQQNITDENLQKQMLSEQVKAFWDFLERYIKSHSIDLHPEGSDLQDAIVELFKTGKFKH